MRSLGRLVRGLSALFWGLPIALVLCVQAVNTNLLDSVRPYGIVAPVAITSMLYYALWLMSGFQRQERVWVLALDRAKVLAIVNIGLAPFLYWNHRMPQEPLFQYAVWLMAMTSVFFLFDVNQVLLRLAAMLPDETLRMETKVFTSLNRSILIAIPVLMGLLIFGAPALELPISIASLAHRIDSLGQWVFLSLILVPIAITMSLIWKIKEAILASVFSHGE